MFIQSVSVPRRRLHAPLQATAREEAAAPGLAPRSSRHPHRARLRPRQPFVPAEHARAERLRAGARCGGRAPSGGTDRWAWQRRPSVAARRAVRSGRMTRAVSVSGRTDGVTSPQGPCLPASAPRGAPLSLRGAGVPRHGPSSSRPACLLTSPAFSRSGPWLHLDLSSRDSDCDPDPLLLSLAGGLAAAWALGGLTGCSREQGCTGVGMVGAVAWGADCQVPQASQARAPAARAHGLPVPWGCSLGARLPLASGQCQVIVSHMQGGWAWP